jgi:predicted NBD/HSP70 family sugar kinase
VYPVSPQDPWVQLAEILRLVRTGEAQTRPELADATRLGRNIDAQRIQHAQELGLLRPSGESRSRGGRAAEVWEFVGERGRIVAAMVGTTGFRVAVTDLDHRVLAETRVAWDMSSEPEATCERIATEMETLLAQHHDGPAWGVGIGLPTPVNYTTGLPVTPVTSAPPGTDWTSRIDVRRWLTRRMQAPVWVDSLSNLTAVGAAAAPDAPDDLIFIRMDRGVGSGIVSDGRLHRGADWIAGEITHVVVHPESDRICLCGRVGCLDAFASRWAIEAEAHRAVDQGRSPHLNRLDHPVLLEDVVAGAESGDPTCAELVLRAAEATGRALAAVVTWFNPRRVVIGGNALADSALFQGAVGRTLHATTLAASVQHLEVLPGSTDLAEEITGASALVLEALMAPWYWAEWGPGGFPIDVEALLAKDHGLQT